MLVAELEQRVVAEPDRCGRVDAPALDRDEVAVAAAVLVDAVQAQRDRVGQRCADVDIAAVEIIFADFEPAADHPVPAGLLGDAVDDAADAAATEHHRVRAAQDLEPLDIVEVAIGLDVVAQAVDEEVGGRGVATEYDRLAIAFSLRRRHAGHILDCLADAGRRTIVDGVPGHHRDRLRHIDQRRVGPCRADDPVRLIASVRRPLDAERVDGGVGDHHAAQAPLRLLILRQRRRGGDEGQSSGQKKMRHESSLLGRSSRLRRRYC